MKQIRHAQSPAQGGEFTICGMSFDSFESGDNDEPIVFAKKGETINCEECKSFIADIHEQFTPTGRIK